MLTLLDGRRRVIGWVAVAALAANLGALVALAAAVLPDGTVVVTTGDWPVGIGITLRADALGVLFALLSSLSLLAATVVQRCWTACASGRSPASSSCWPPG